MEYIPNEELEQLSAYLTDLTLGSSRLNGKIEAFTSRYRKPTRISRGRFHMRKKTNQGDEDIDDEGNEGTNRVAAVPSYLATGLIFDDTQQTNSADVSMTIDLTSSSASSVPFEGFAPSSSSGGSTVALAFNESLLTMPRRQRSFSFTSCYTMRKPARRRTSSLGDLTEPSSRILLLDLVTALNESFPDYDFGDTKIEQFKDQDLPAVVSHINSYLAELTVKDPLTLERMWSGIDEVVNLRQCEIFQFSPEKNDDDDADANLWEFHYFFFNKDLHAICYFNCYAER